MQEKIQALINKVTENCSRSDFEYREWFVNYHLRIVEEIALKLCESYPEADKNVVHVMAWTHDFSKPLTTSKEDEKVQLIPMVRENLAQLGFESEFVNRVCAALEEVESKDAKPIAEASIEARIISSADGAAHFLSPFFYTYFGNRGSVVEIMQKVLTKAQRDWDKKITLPEARNLVRARYEALQEDLRLRD